MTDRKTIGIILINLGGPDSPDAIKPFLFNLFSDREIIRLGPALLQKPIAYLISSLRSKKSKKMYSLIGGKSPLLDITLAQAEALEEALNKQSSVVSRQSSVNNYSLFTVHYPLSFKVYVGMRYWHPFIKDTVERVLKDGIKHLIVLSLYPHYSKATTGSVIGEFKKAISRFTLHGSRHGESPVATQFTVKYIEHWYDFPPYIKALAELISEGISEFKGNLDILYSAHNLPEELIKKGDPYINHIKTTIAAVNSSLVTRYSLLVKWHLSFQSKTGPIKWLSPSTDETIIRLAKTGSRNLFVVPISFVSDNIETLYEIDILYKELAIRHGINFKRCPCLNTSEKFIDAMKELVFVKELK